MPSGIRIPDDMPDKDRSRRSLAASLRLPEATRFIGFVGRVSEDKGVASILKAFQPLSHQFPDTHVVIVGDGTDQYIEFLKDLAKNLKLDNRIHFTGFQKNTWPFYRALDCKILPSKDVNGIPFEGIPQSLLEAMAAECPVVGSKSGGITDIIDHKKTGLLFDPENIQELTDRISETLHREESAGQRLERARDHVLKNHTIDAMGRNIIRIYRLHQVRQERQL